LRRHGKRVKRISEICVHLFGSGRSRLGILGHIVEFWYNNDLERKFEWYLLFRGISRYFFPPEGQKYANSGKFPRRNYWAITLTSFQALHLPGILSS
jgi:hypothetical protein